MARTGGVLLACAGRLLGEKAAAKYQVRRQHRALHHLYLRDQCAIWGRHLLLMGCCGVGLAGGGASAAPAGSRSGALLCLHPAPPGRLHLLWPN